MTDQTISWLRELAAKGGKGIVNNIDARSLGRVADELERLSRPAQCALPDREAIARVIDPGPFWEVIPGCRWSRFEEQRKEYALKKADDILALSAVTSTDRCEN